MFKAKSAALKNLYERVYSSICGVHPRQNLLHWQWLHVRRLRQDLKRTLSTIKGKVLDVGCGERPYKAFLPEAVSYGGLDINEAAAPDILAKRDEKWDLPDSSFDAVICSQVLEHVRDLPVLLHEIARVLKGGGILIVTAPFIYNQHDPVHDYRRFSPQEMESLLAFAFDILEVKRQGAIGSTLGGLFLNWVFLQACSARTSRLAFALALPFWLLLCAAVNLAAAALDAFDGTEAFYGNIMVRARKHP